MNTTDQNRAAQPEPEPAPQETPGSRPRGTHALYRPLDDRMIGGVASGIARYLDVDVSVVRILLAVLVFVGGTGVPLYLAGWLLIPEEGASQSIASEFIGSLQTRSL